MNQPQHPLLAMRGRSGENVEIEPGQYEMLEWLDVNTFA